jgi:hypothetical protein
VATNPPASPAPSLNGFGLISAPMFTNGTGNVTIDSNSNIWIFDSTGNLTLPGNTFAINYANGSQVSISGGSSSSSNISNGNSNVSIATANGNVTINAVGNTTMTITGTGANVIGNLNVTGNITGGNLITTGNVYASNVIINGQTLTATGAVNPDYINMTTSAAVSVAASGTDLTWDVNNGSSGIAYSAGKFSLAAGKTYHILAELAMQEYSANGYLLVELVDGTTNARIGSQTVTVPYNSGFNEVNNPTLDIVHTPVANQDVKLRVTGGTSGLTAQLRGGGFARMSIVQMNPNVSLGAVSTISASGNITGGNLITSGVVSATGNVTGNFFIGNGSQLTGIVAAAGSNISNGNSNVSIATANGNVTINAVGNNVVTITGTGANITGTANITGNVTPGNITFSSNTGQIVFGTGAFIGGNANSLTRDGSILLQPYTGVGSTFPGVIIGGAGRLLAPNGGVFQIFNSSDVTFQVAIKSTISTAATSTTTGALIIPGGAGLAGSITTGVGALLTGPTFTPLANTMAGFVSNVNSYTQLTIQNKSTGADATTDFIATADNGTDTVNYADFGIINSGYDANTPTNSLGNIVSAADTYLYAQGNVSNTNQSGGNLAIGTTIAGKSVKIFAGGVTNNSIIATISNTGVAVNGNVTATNFSGNISITGNVTGTSPNVTLVAGSYSYVFDNAGALTLPAGSGTGGGDEGGEIAFTQAANSTLSGNTVIVDQYADRIRFFEAGGTTRGAYIDITQAATGVGTLLNNRVSGLVNAGTFVTMDNLKATITSSGNRGLSLATVTGSDSYLICGTYSVNGGSNGSAGSIALTTSASASVFSWNFLGAGDGAIFTLTDSSNSRAYRITIQIGASFNNNMISIERLV